MNEQQYRLNYRKMDDGRWGIWSPMWLEPGSDVVVTKKSGEARTETVGELAYSLSNGAGFVYSIATPAKPKPQPERRASNVGDMSGILALFDKARRHLKHPAIVLGIPALGDMLVRINVAGNRARVPGSLNVTSERDDAGERDWYGRILKAGSFEPSRACLPHMLDAMVARLRDFAARPAEVAAEHGRLTGRCCFCNRHLEDERSTAVGYGPVCADHYGLPWGANAAPAVIPGTKPLPRTTSSRRRDAAPRLDHFDGEEPAAFGGQQRDADAREAAGLAMLVADDVDQMVKQMFNPAPGQRRSFISKRGRCVTVDYAECTGVDGDPHHEGKHCACRY